MCVGSRGCTVMASEQSGLDNGSGFAYGHGPVLVGDGRASVRQAWLWWFWQEWVVVTETRRVSSVSRAGIDRGKVLAVALLGASVAISDQPGTLGWRGGRSFGHRVRTGFPSRWCDPAQWLRRKGCLASFTADGDWLACPWLLLIARPAFRILAMGHGDVLGCIARLHAVAVGDVGV